MRLPHKSQLQNINVLQYSSDQFDNQTIKTVLTVAVDHVSVRPPPYKEGVRYHYKIQAFAQTISGA